MTENVQFTQIQRQSRIHRFIQHTYPLGRGRGEWGEGEGVGEGKREGEGGGVNSCVSSTPAAGAGMRATRVKFNPHHQAEWCLFVSFVCFIA